MAQATRFAVMLLGGLAGVLAFLWLRPGWLAWLALLIIFVIGSAVAEFVFRRLATPEVIRDDLEDRVRNPHD